MGNWKQWQRDLEKLAALEREIEKTLDALEGLREKETAETALLFFVARDEIPPEEQYRAADARARAALFRILEKLYWQRVKIKTLQDVL